MNRILKRQKYQRNSVTNRVSKRNAFWRNPSVARSVKRALCQKRLEEKRQAERTRYHKKRTTTQRLVVMHDMCFGHGMARVMCRAAAMVT